MLSGFWNAITGTPPVGGKRTRDVMPLARPIIYQVNSMSPSTAVQGSPTNQPSRPASGSQLPPAGGAVDFTTPAPKKKPTKPGEISQSPFVDMNMAFLDKLGDLDPLLNSQTPTPLQQTSSNQQMIVLNMRPSTQDSSVGNGKAGMDELPEIRTDLTATIASLRNAVSPALASATDKQKPLDAGNLQPADAKNASDPSNPPQTKRTQAPIQNVHLNLSLPNVLDDVVFIGKPGIFPEAKIDPARLHSIADKLCKSVGQSRPVGDAPQSTDAGLADIAEKMFDTECTLENYSKLLQSKPLDVGGVCNWLTSDARFKVPLHPALAMLCLAAANKQIWTSELVTAACGFATLFTPCVYEEGDKTCARFCTESWSVALPLAFKGDLSALPFMKVLRILKMLVKVDFGMYNGKAVGYTNKLTDAWRLEFPRVTEGEDPKEKIKEGLARRTRSGHSIEWKDPGATSQFVIQATIAAKLNFLQVEIAKNRRSPPPNATTSAEVHAELQLFLAQFNHVSTRSEIVKRTLAADTTTPSPQLATWTRMIDAIAAPVDNESAGDAALRWSWLEYLNLLTQVQCVPLPVSQAPKSTTKADSQTLMQVSLDCLVAGADIADALNLPVTDGTSGVTIQGPYCATSCHSPDGATKVWYVAQTHLVHGSKKFLRLCDAMASICAESKGKYLPFFYPASISAGGKKPKNALKRMRRPASTTTHLGVLEINDSIDTETAKTNLSRMKLSTQFVAPGRMLFIKCARQTTTKCTDYLPLGITAHALVVPSDKGDISPQLQAHLHKLYVGNPSRPDRKGTGEKQHLRPGAWALLRATLVSSGDATDLQSESQEQSQVPASSQYTDPSSSDRVPHWNTIPAEIIATALRNVVATSPVDGAAVGETYARITKPAWTTNRRELELALRETAFVSRTSSAVAYMRHVSEFMVATVTEAMESFHANGVEVFSEISAPLLRRILRGDAEVRRPWQFIRFAVDCEPELHTILDPIVEKMRDSSVQKGDNRVRISTAMFEMCVAVRARNATLNDDTLMHRIHLRLVRMMLSLVLCECKPVHGYAAGDKLTARDNVELDMAWSVLLSMWIHMPMNYLSKRNNGAVDRVTGFNATQFPRASRKAAFRQFSECSDMEVIRHYLTVRLGGFYDLSGPPIELLGSGVLPIHALKSTCLQLILKHNMFDSVPGFYSDANSLANRAWAATDHINLTTALQCMQFERRLFSRLSAPQTSFHMAAAKRVADRLQRSRECAQFELRVKEMLTDFEEGVATQQSLRDAYWHFIWNVPHHKASINKFAESIPEHVLEPEYTRHRDVIERQKAKGDSEPLPAKSLLFQEENGDRVTTNACSVFTAAIRALPLTTLRSMWDAVNNVKKTGHSTVIEFGVSSAIQRASQMSAAVENAFCLRGVQLETLINADGRQVSDFENALSKSDDLRTAAVDAILTHLAMQFVIRVYVASTMWSGTQLHLVWLLCSDIANQVRQLIHFGLLSVPLVDTYAQTKDATLTTAVRNLVLMLGMCRDSDYDPDQLVYMRSIRCEPAENDILTGDALVVLSNLTRIYITLPTNIGSDIVPVITRLFDDSENKEYTAEVVNNVELGTETPGTIFATFIAAVADKSGEGPEDALTLFDFRKIESFTNERAFGDTVAHRVAHSSAIAKSMRRSFAGGNTDISHTVLEKTCMSVVCAVRTIVREDINAHELGTSSWTNVLRRAFVFLTEIAYAKSKYGMDDECAYARLLLAQKRSLLLCNDDELSMPLAICAYWDNSSRVIAFAKEVNALLSDAPAVDVARVPDDLHGDEVATLPADTSKAPNAPGYGAWRAIGSALFGDKVAQPKAEEEKKKQRTETKTEANPARASRAVAIDPDSAEMASFAPTRTDANEAVLNLIDHLSVPHKFRVWFEGIADTKWLQTLKDNEWNDGSMFEMYSRGLPIPEKYPAKRKTAIDVDAYERSFVKLWNFVHDEQSVYDEDLKFFKVENEGDSKKHAAEKLAAYCKRATTIQGKQVYVAMIRSVHTKLPKKREVVEWTPIIIGLPTKMGLRHPEMFMEEQTSEDVDALRRITVKLVYPPSRENEPTVDEKRRMASVDAAWKRSEEWIRRMAVDVLRHCGILDELPKNAKGDIDILPVKVCREKPRQGDTSTSPDEAYRNSFALHSSMTWSASYLKREPQYPTMCNPDADVAADDDATASHVD